MLLGAGAPAAIDVKNVLVFNKYFGHVFYVLNVFFYFRNVFFIFKKNVAKVNAKDHVSL